MITKGAEDFYVFILVFLKIKFLDAQAANKTANQDGVITSIEPRFFDLGGPGSGYPNLREPGRNGNSPSNYPGNSFLPNGNQNENMQRPQSGWRPEAEYPNQGRPHQEPGLYQNNYPENYPQNYPGNRPDNYPGNRPDNYPGNRPDNYPGNRPGNYPGIRPDNYPGNNPDIYPGNQDSRYPQNSNNYRPNDYNGEYRPGPNNNMNQYPNYQRPPYYNSPPDRRDYPGNTNRPYQNTGRPLYPPQNEQYPPQRDNPNQRPDDLSFVYRPEYPDDVLDSKGQLPGNNIRTNPYPPNNTPYINYPPNPIGNQFPNQGDINQNQGNYNPASNQAFQGNLNGIPTTIPQVPNNRPMDSINGPNANDSAAIPGKPVFIPPSNAPTGQVLLDSSTQSPPTQMQCEQACPTTSEYNPICGTNNVTYGNPGRFNCARNCGINVNVLRLGKCLDVSNQVNSG